VLSEFCSEPSIPHAYADVMCYDPQNNPRVGMTIGDSGGYCFHAARAAPGHNKTPNHLQAGGSVVI